MVYTKQQVRDRVVQLIYEGFYEDATFLIEEGLERDWDGADQEFDEEIVQLMSSKE